jgi:phospholipid/cholesterol/gamma-HCH transport system substrate-binding protein
MTDSKRTVRACGIAMILTIAAAFGLTTAFYNHAFAHPLVVILKTSRTGLVMDAGNVVKMHGVVVGRVGSIRPDASGGAVMTLELDREQIGQIPANVSAEIRSSTVFGAKYVALVPPARPSAVPIAAGSVIDNSLVTTEVNTIFKSLDTLLSSVNVTDLNVTLNSLSVALRGRGATIATMARDADSYLSRLEPLLPQLRRDLYQVARFGRLGVRVSPALLRILENATVTGNTLVTQQQALDRLLVSLSVLGGEGAHVLGVNSRALASVLRNLRPTTGTLAAYSTELPCLLKGLDRTRDIMAGVIGGTRSALIGRVSIRGELPAYTLPKGLPAYPHGRGPDCAALPLLAASHIPFPERGAPQ